MDFMARAAMRKVEISVLCVCRKPLGLPSVPEVKFR
jgi:hypothetical protein